MSVCFLSFFCTHPYCSPHSCSWKNCPFTVYLATAGVQLLHLLGVISFGALNHLQPGRPVVLPSWTFLSSSSFAPLSLISFPRFHVCSFLVYFLIFKEYIFQELSEEGWKILDVVNFSISLLVLS